MLGSWDLNDDWSLDGSFATTRPDLNGDPSVVRAANVYAMSLGPSWTLGDHWLFMGTAGFSPKSTQLTQATLTFDDKVPPAGSKDHPAQIHAESTSGGLSLMASYDTAGESDWETSISATANWNHYGTLQKIAAVEVGGKTVDPATLTAACANAASKGCKLFKTLLRAQQDALDQGSVGLLVTETIHQDWDASLGATYYVYSQDPNDVGVFSIATRGTNGAGARANAGGTMEYGEGIPLSAFQFNTQAGAAWHAYGWKVAVIESVGRYVDNGGGLTATTFKVAYKFNKNWKLLSSFAFQRDTDSAGAASTGLLGSVTLRFMW